MEYVSSSARILRDSKFNQSKLERYNFDIFVFGFSSLIKLQNLK